MRALDLKLRLPTLLVRCLAMCLFALAALDAIAWPSSPGSLTNRTLRDGGAGCVSCHAQDASIAVSISGPTSVPVGVTASYTISASKSGIGAGIKMGMAAAASGGGDIGKFAANLVRMAATNEVIHDSTTFPLNATNASGVASYTVRYTMPAGATVGSTHMLYAVSRLGGNGWNHAPNFTIVAAANSPPAPTIGAVSAGNGQVTVNFTPPATNGGSTITGYTVTSSPGDFTVTGTASPLTVTGLANGTTYTFTVRASNAIGDSIESASSAPAMPGIAPSAPLNVTAVRGNASAAVSFDPPAMTGTGPISQYTATAAPGGLTATGSTSPITLSGLTNGTPYTFTVKATNAFGPGPESAASNAVTPQPIPGAPSNVMTAAGNGQVALSFDAANDGGSAITSYLVNVSPNAGTDSAAGTAALTRTITGLTNGTAYTFSVTAINAFGNGPASAPAFATPFTVPDAPTSVVATAANGAASVTFVAPTANGAAITGYTVVSNPAGGADANAGSTSLTHTVNGLTNGTSYTFTVVATNGAGPGPASAPSNAVVPGGASAPQVVWTQVLPRDDVSQSTCSTPVARRGPTMDAAGNPFVNGCSRLDGTWDVRTHKLDGATVQVLWTATFTDFPVAGSSAIMGQALVGDPAGNAFLVSNSRDESNFLDQVRVVKYNGETGQVMWSGGYASQSSDEIATDAGTDADGNLFINTQSPLGLHTVKVSGATGAQQWDNAVSANARGLAVDAAGNVAVTGNTGGGNSDFRVAKYNGATGALLWNTTWSAPTCCYDGGESVAVNAAGDVFAIGLSPGGSALVKFAAADGNLVWSVPTTANWSGLAVDNAGNVFVTGSSSDAVGGTNMRTTKYDGVSGAQLWSVSLNGSANGTDGAVRMALDAQGNAVIVGRSRETSGADNIRSAKYRGGDGALIWTHQYLNNFNDNGFQVAIAPDGAAIVTGAVLLGSGDYALVVQKLADPVASPLVLRSAVSRKTHGAAGPFDVPLTLGVPVTGAVSVEPRAAGSGHQVVFVFDGAISQAGAASVQNAAGANIPDATATFSGDEVTVTLPAIPDATRVTVSVNGVNGSVNAAVTMGFLLGDANGSSKVDTTDLTATRSQSGKSVTQDNFRHDINVTGLIGAADVAAIKSRLNRMLP